MMCTLGSGAALIYSCLEDLLFFSFILELFLATRTPRAHATSHAHTHHYTHTSLTHTHAQHTSFLPLPTPLLAGGTTLLLLLLSLWLGGTVNFLSPRVLDRRI